MTAGLSSGSASPSRAAAAIAGEGEGVPDLSRLAEIAAAHGIDIVGPPLVP